MPGHQTLAATARTLQTDETTLLDFGRRSWIEIVEKRGTTYMDGHQQYKAKYILHLRNRRKLSDEEITLVLSVQQPPYSAGEVDDILASRKAATVI